MHEFSRFQLKLHGVSFKFLHSHYTSKASVRHQSTSHHFFSPSKWGNKMSITFQRFSMAKLESLTPFSQLRIETLSFGVRNLSSSLLEDCSQSTRVWGWLILRQLFHMSLLDFHNCSLFHHQLGTEQLVVRSLSWGVPSLVPTPLMANPPLSWPCRFSHNILPIPEIWLHPFS